MITAQQNRHSDEGGGGGRTRFEGSVAVSCFHN